MFLRVRNKSVAIFDTQILANILKTLGKKSKSITITLRGHKDKYPCIYVNYKYYLLHRLTAEYLIGRKLKGNEMVHHKDGNILNSTPDNLEVMFYSKHCKLHLTGNKNRLGGKKYLDKRS